MLLMAYYAALEDLTTDQFKESVSCLIRTRKYSTLPVPAEIREAAVGDLDGAAMLALTNFERSRATYGANNSVAFEDPTIHVVVMQMGGWIKVNGIIDSEWKFTRNDFLKLYKAIAPKINNYKILHHLVGIAEGDNWNQPEDKKVFKLQYFGDRERIQAWQETLGVSDTFKQITCRRQDLVGELTQSMTAN